MKLTRRGIFGATVAALGLPRPSRAAGYPTGPVKLIVPFAPGGNIDITARLVAKPLGEALGQSVIVMNMTGAGGLVGAANVAKANPDGYTLLLGSTSSLTTAPAVNKRVTFDAAKDFTALGAVQAVPLLLTVAADFPARNFADLVAFSQKNGAVSVANSGTGTINQLVVELIKERSKLLAFSVPYGGSGPALTDLVGGQVQAMSDQISSSLSLIKDGRIRAIVQLGKARSSLLPDVPTIGEAGVPDIDAFTFTGIFGPAHLPADVQATLEAAIAKAMKDESMRARFKDLGAEMMTITPAELGALIAHDVTLWKSVAQTAHISIQ